MNFTKLERALASDLFISPMVSIETPPTIEEIKGLSEKMPFTLSNDHIQLLQRFGGSFLDEIRIEAPNQIEVEDGLISFANNYNGYRFVYNQNNEIFGIDHNGGAIIKLANSMDEFFNDVFLGRAGESFYGSDWINDLVDAGLI